MLPAVETPTEERAAIIDRASRGAEIHALTVRIGGKHEYRIPRRLICQNVMPIRLHIVALFRVKKQTLIAFATLGACIAGHDSLTD